MFRKVALVFAGFLSFSGALSLVSGVTLAVKLSRPGTVLKSLYHTPKPPIPQTTLEDRYLDLMKRVLTRYGFENSYGPLPAPKGAVRKWAVASFNGVMLSRGMQLSKYQAFDPEIREEGRDWPPEAETMVGLKRLDNIQFCVTDVISRKIPGDLIECGAWRGGSCIFMRAILAAYGVKDRTVWVSDSFEGLPKPDLNLYPTEAAHRWAGGEMAVSLDEVRENFRKYGLLDEQVKFLKGFFKDTLPKAPLGPIAVLRVDGDLYESVTETLEFVYPKVVVGGYVILDDYGEHLPPAKQAVDDYRKAHGISEPIQRIDYSGAYWRRER
jgi:O-methyltransferase